MCIECKPFIRSLTMNIKLTEHFRISYLAVMKDNLMMLSDWKYLWLRHKSACCNCNLKKIKSTALEKNKKLDNTTLVFRDICNGKLINIGKNSRGLL